MRDCSLKPLALIVVLVATASALVMIAPASDAETYDGTIDLYGYKITMGLIEPNQVLSVEWDFGDGSEKVTVQITSDNPVGTVQHTYSEKGDYVVTATMRNKYTNSEGQLVDGESKLTYLYHIYGYPIVSFDSKGGSSVPSIEGIKSHYVPTKPADPTKAGFGFTGWYTDPECTKAFDWTSEVAKHTTLYAGWNAIPATTYTSVLKYDANGGTGAPADDAFTGASTEAHVFTAASSVPVREGYRFDGWADTSDAVSSVYKAGDAVSVDHDGTKTIYAVWLKILTIDVDAPASAVIGTLVTAKIHVNQVELECVPNSADAWTGYNLVPESDGTGGYDFVLTFTPVKTGTLSIVLTAENTGCVTATETVQIEILSNGLTAPPSAEGIEAVVKG